MIRARAGRHVLRPLPILAVLVVLIVTACSGQSTPTVGPASLAPTQAGGSEVPASATLPPTSSGAIPTTPGDTAQPSSAADGCTGNANNLAFFAKAATVMTWPVFCAVLPDGWFVENGTYRMANGGELEVSYDGPGDVHLGMVEGNACDQFGSDINACAPRNSMIGQASLGGTTGEIGQLSNAYVLDVDRGANPSWRVTGLGMTEAQFRALCAAMLVVKASN